MTRFTLKIDSTKHVAKLHQSNSFGPDCLPLPQDDKNGEMVGFDTIPEADKYAWGLKMKFELCQRCLFIMETFTVE